MSGRNSNLMRGFSDAGPITKKEKMDMRDAVTVAVRIRPFNSDEKEAQMSASFRAGEDGNSVSELDENGDIAKNWAYGHVFGPEYSNQYVYEKVGSSLVAAALDGYNTVLFAYGQTASGKTFTLFGGGGTPGLVDHSIRGVQETVSASVETEFVIKMLFVELYNEELRDLLATSESGPDLKIIEDPMLGPMIQNITEVGFTSVDQVRQALDEGDARRHFGVTNMNAHSSRSHVMVRLSIESRKVLTKPANPLRQSWGKDKPTCFSTLNLVDLAGSERANKSGTSGQALKEGSFINKSLLTLGTVIANLSEGKLGQHVPYRNSKLTRLLASALGGNAKTTMITCISPAIGNIGESLSTLRFASRAKRIVNNVRKNELDDMKSLGMKLSSQKAEIDSLRDELEEAKMNGGGGALKERCLGAIRKVRSLKYLVKNSGRVVRALVSEGKPTVAKRVRSDIKDALFGIREISEVMEDHEEMLESNLAANEKIMGRMHAMQRANATLTLDEATSDLDGYESDTYSVTSDGDDIFSPSYKSEEVKIELESAHMAFEDLLCSSSRTINGLEEVNRRSLELEKENSKQIMQLTKENEELMANLKATQASELLLRASVVKLRQSADEEKASTLMNQDMMSKKIQSMESSLFQKDDHISDLQNDLMDKIATIERLKSDIEQAKKNAVVSEQQRRAFEAEAERTRNDMRLQMDRLRSNMHGMLQQGGENSKILENQNAQLNMEMSQLRDEILSLRKNKTASELEIRQLRREIQNNAEDAKRQSIETNKLRNQVNSSNEAIRAMRLELSQAQAKSDVLDQDNNQLREKLRENAQNAQTELDSCEEVLKKATSDHAAERNTLQVEISNLMGQLEIESLRFEDKQSAYTRLEQQYHAEVSRLEKKCISANKQYDETMAQKTAVYNILKAKVNGVLNTNKTLTAKVAELESWNASVHEFISLHDAKSVTSEEVASESEMLASDEEGSFIFGDDDSYDQVDRRRVSFNEGHMTILSELSSPRSPKLPQSPGVNTPKSLLSPWCKSMDVEYELIKNGMHTVLLSLDHALKDSVMMHECQAIYVEKTRQRKTDRVEELVSLRTSCATLDLAKNNLEEQLKVHQNKEIQLLSELSELQKVVADTENSYQAFLAAEELKTMQNNKFSAEKDTWGVQMQKLRLERAQLEDECARVNSSMEELEEELGRYEDFCVEQESRLQEALRRAQIAEAEKDELMRQFLGSSDANC